MLNCGIKISLFLVYFGLKIPTRGLFLYIYKVKIFIKDFFLNKGSLSLSRCHFYVLCLRGMTSSFVFFLALELISVFMFFFYIKYAVIIMHKNNKSVVL